MSIVDQALVANNLKLVHKVLQKHSSIMAALNVEYEDAFQIGAIGLIKAAKKYDPARGPFATIATLNIVTELSHHYRYLNSSSRKAKVYSLQAPIQHHSAAVFQDMLPDKRNYEHEIVTDVAVGALLEKLADREKKILRSMYFEGMESRVQLQRELGLSETMVYKSIYKIQAMALKVLGIKKAAC